ncbi:rRNA pseudouridine synthase [Candidatus Saccharibacteria bacterium]|nr:rRNA pseudouridine synthase [Candidatus Saccharibacteria bacterium]
MTPDNINLRLNKYLALHLGVSRREADNLIDAGTVQINGQVAALGARFNEGDQITVDGKDLTATTGYEYIALNKPAGYVCSRKQQGDHPTIYELLPPEMHNLKPVGRLDRDSSGIILLTNDGDFAYQMTHPKFHKIKVYQVRLNHDLEPLHQQMISDHGITLDDGVSKLSLERMSDHNRRDWTITMHEGRNRQIRRTFASIGYNVVKLHRTNFGNYQLGDLKSGKYEEVTK